MLKPALTDEEIARELAEIRRTLAGLAEHDGESGIGPELGSIRAQLRTLAEQNADVGARLAVSLGLETPPVH